MGGSGSTEGERRKFQIEVQLKSSGDCKYSSTPEEPNGNIVDSVVLTTIYLS